MKTRFGISGGVRIGFTTHHPSQLCEALLPSLFHYLENNTSSVSLRLTPSPTGEGFSVGMSLLFVFHSCEWVCPPPASS